MILVTGVAIFVLGTFLLSSVRHSAEGLQEDATLMARLQKDERVYSGYVLRYIDGQSDAARLEARAALEADFEQGIQGLHSVTSRGLLSEAYALWRSEDLTRRPLGPSTSAAERLARHAEVTAEDIEMMSLVDEAGEDSRRALSRSLASADRIRILRLMLIPIFSLGTLWWAAAMIRRLETEVLLPLKALDDGARRLADGDVEHHVQVSGVDELGRLAHSFNVMADAIATSQRALEHEANHDPLTGLPNRRAFNARMSAMMDGPERRTGSTAMLVMDLDGFKEVNDSLGHAAGDEVLCVAARRLLAASRETDFVARIGGDEFGVLLQSVSGPEDVREIAQRLASAISEDLEISGQKVRIGATTGVALREDCDDAESTMHAADAAMYRAKVGPRAQGGDGRASRSASGRGRAGAGRA